MKDGKVILTRCVNCAVWERSGAAPVVLHKGIVVPRPDLRDCGSLPRPVGAVTGGATVQARDRTFAYRTAVEDHLVAKVVPYVSGGWVDHNKTKIGYEISRHFQKYIRPRSLPEIDGENKQLEAEILDLSREVTE